LKAHKQLLDSVPHSLLIIAPRKPERFKSVHNKINDSELASIKWSEFKGLDANVEVLLIDTLGDLPFFYSVSDIAFVGGSLCSVGGHNLLEPVSFEKPILTGPFLENVKEISSELIEAGGLLLVKDSEELSSQLNNLFADESIKEQMVSGARRVMQKNKGSIDNIMKLIGPLIKA
jgi:3-deoxy-D-manno-octulosonic-acid transferase